MPFARLDTYNPANPAYQWVSRLAASRAACFVPAVTSSVPSQNLGREMLSSRMTSGTPERIPVPRLLICKDSISENSISKDSILKDSILKDSKEPY